MLLRDFWKDKTRQGLWIGGGEGSKKKKKEEKKKKRTSSRLLILKQQGQDRIVNALGCNADTKHLYSGGWDNCVRSWDLTTFTRLDAIDLGQAVNCIRVDPDNGDIYVGANQGIVAKLRDE